MDKVKKKAYIYKPRPKIRRRISLKLEIGIKKALDNIFAELFGMNYKRRTRRIQNIYSHNSLFAIKGALEWKIHMFWMDSAFQSIFNEINQIKGSINRIIYLHKIRI